MIRILESADKEAIFARDARIADVSGAVAEIISQVRKRGDEALRDFTERFDGVRPENLEVDRREWDEGAEAADPDLKRIIEKAAANIRAFHSKQVKNGFMLNDRNGVFLGQKVIPVDVAAIYVPGGTAAYPSTVLMDCIPAKLAGCPQVIMATPPGADGKLAPAILFAARTAGVDRIFKMGGAQAIAALAYGTDSVPKADKIVGPGNAYVAEAKRQVFGDVSIDMIAGPSEILIVSDAKSDPKVLAADLLSQAEHDRMASAVLITDSRELARRVSDELEKQIPLLERRDIARESIDKNGKIVIVDSVEQAVELSNELAPEHLELCVDDPFSLIDRVRHAGSVFMGRNCPEALGDYMAGPNHTLPTGGRARFSSPLSVDDFTKTMQISYYSRDALKEIATDVKGFAEAEGLTAHARSAVIRFEGDK